MSKIDALKHPIDTLRTAPFGFSIIASNLILPVACTIDFIEDPKVADVLTAGIGVPGIVLGGWMAAGQFKLKRRAKEELVTGFNEKFFRKTTDEWCARQTVKTALKGTPHSSEYESICEEQKHTAKFAWIPHL